MKLLALQAAHKIGRYICDEKWWSEELTKKEKEILKQNRYWPSWGPMEVIHVHVIKGYGDTVFTNVLSGDRYF